jgi:hypothetical protein
MPLSSTTTCEIRRLKAKDKAALADHLWREAEGSMSPTLAQLAMLNGRASQAMRQPATTRPLGDALRRLKK